MAIFCDAVAADALRGVRGPLHLALWEADVLGLDDDTFDALLESHRQRRIGNITNLMPMPIAA